MLKKLSSLVFAFLAALLLILPGMTVNAEEAYSYQSYYYYQNPETGYCAVFNDEAGFLSSSSSEQITELYAVLQGVTEYCNVDFETTTYHYSGSAENYIVDQLESNFGYNSKSIGFVIDRCYNEIYLISEGAARKQLNNSRCTAICDNTYIYATSSRNYDYYTCTLETYTLVLDALEGRRISAPFRIITSILLALAIGMIICYFIAKATSRQKVASRSQILKGAFTRFEIINGQSRFVNQTKRYSPPSSSSGGGGHSGGGGGGGGGGHSGGGHGI